MGKCEGLVAQAFFVGPGRITKEAVKLPWIGLLDDAHGVLQGLADVDCYLPHILPMTAIWDLKAMVLGKGRIVHVVFALLQRQRIFLHPDIADPLEKQQGEDD